MYHDSDSLTESSTRVLSLPLEEAEWRALLDVEPNPVEWLRQQIRERLEDSRAQTAATRPAGLYAAGRAS